MSSLEKRYLTITRIDKSQSRITEAPAMLIITIVFLVAVLSVPLQEPQKLIWLAAYPIIFSEIAGIGYLKVLLKSLWIIPLVALIGMFNPIIDTEPAFSVGDKIISKGWVSFISIVLRGILSLQGVILLVETTGFLDIFNTLLTFKCPTLLVTQLQLTYRYISVIIEEAVVMRRARESRGFGEKSYPLKMWAAMIGQLLLRSIMRATRIHRAMLARGFNGSIPTGTPVKWTKSSLIRLFFSILFILLLRFTDFSSLIVKLVNHPRI